MPMGSCRDDLNQTGESFRNGSPLPNEPDEHSNPIPPSSPVLNSNPIPIDPAFNSNVVNWSPSPNHFGNNIS
jgi:hypothetical protein